MEKLFNDTSRWLHFWWGVGIAITLTIVASVVAATTAEYKDKAHGGKWDWRDWLCTVLGGLLGQAVQVLIVCIICELLWI